MERDICCLVLSVCVRTSQPFVDETGVNRVIFFDEPQPQPQPRPSIIVKPVASRLITENAEQKNARLPADGSVGMLSAKVEVEVEEVDQVCLGNVVAYAESHKRLLPEMLRVREWFER